MGAATAVPAVVTGNAIPAMASRNIPSNSRAVTSKARLRATEKKMNRVLANYRNRKGVADLSLVRLVEHIHKNAKGSCLQTFEDVCLLDAFSLGSGEANMLFRVSGVHQYKMYTVGTLPKPKPVLKPRLNS